MSSPVISPLSSLGALQSDVAGGDGTFQVIVGTNGDDELSGTSGDDVIKGRGGADFLDGGSGDDRLLGGTGDDSLSGGSGNDILDGGAGFDQARLEFQSATATTLDLSGFEAGQPFSVSDGQGGTDLLRNIEQIEITLTGGPITLIGSSGADQIFADTDGGKILGGDGNDEIIGGRGAVLKGQAGDDIIDLDGGGGPNPTIVDGGPGHDLFRLSWDGTTPNLTIDATAHGFVGSTADGFQVFSATSIESLYIFDFGGAATITGSAGDDFLLAVSFDDHSTDLLKGGDGNDSLYGGASADTLLGGAGDDTIDGNAGSDILNGGDGDDRYVYRINAFNGAAYVFDASTFDTSGKTFTLNPGDGSTVTLTSFEAVQIQGNGANPNLLIGSIGDDVLIGGQNDDTLKGGDGRDVLTGGWGSDELHGGAGADRFAFDFLQDSTNGHPDLIADLTDKDTIDLSVIDADTALTGDQAFVLVAAFSHQAGQLTLSYDADSNVTTLAADVDGDGKADMTILISGDHIDFTHFVL